METNKLKKFAQEARVKLLQQIEGRLNYVLLNKNTSTELLGKAQAVKALEKAISSSNLGTVVEKTAYTWFNRLIALRFMDANGYQPLGIKVVSSATGNSHIPELLDEVNSGRIPSGLKVDEKLILDILDGRVASTNPDNEVYRMLLVAACNGLHEIFPFLFEEINDYTELLLPEDLTSDKSIIYDVVKGMDDESCAEVEIIGWLYQFYISERKDEVFASKSKVKKEDIPAATQLFTPRWIVEYMVQNTVGKLWMQNNPQSSLKDHMPYYIESPSAASEDCLKIESPEEITLLDQACGSGHILVYGFELLSKIYEEEGYSPSEIPALIIKNNLFGFEIDDRASQLAGMAIMMKAREYHRRFFRKGNVPEPNILCYQDLTLSDDEVKSVFKKLSVKPSDELIYDLGNMRQATNFGSLIIPHSSALEIHQTLEATLKLKKSGDAFIQYQADQLYSVLNQLELLARKYSCLVANPPYMGGGKMNPLLSDWIKQSYPNSKSDLFSAFIDRSLVQVEEAGYNGLVTMESWMFLSSFEKFRENLIKNYRIHSLSHFGWHIMRIAFGTVSFIIQRSKPDDGFKGVYNYLEIDDTDRKLERPLSFPKKDNGRYKEVNQKDFLKIPGNPIGYWVPSQLLKVFEEDKIANISDARLGMATADNLKFLRFIWEVNIHSVELSKTSRIEAKDSGLKWFWYAKGGEYRKWYGNLEYVVNWYNDGEEIRGFTDKNGKVRSHNYNLDFIFKKGITWNALTSGNTSFRLLENAIFDNAGSSLFLFNENDFHRALAVLNSKVTRYVLPVINPTLNYQPGTISKVPIPRSLEIDHKKVETLLEISKKDWDSRESSHEFKANPLTLTVNDDLEEAYDLYEQYWTLQMKKMLDTEYYLESHIADEYGLNHAIELRKDFRELSILNNETVKETNSFRFEKKEILSQFVSYSVGSMFGRYALQKKGLIIANHGETLRDYLAKVGMSKDEVSFLPDDDNIIPVLDDEWFEDDIVGRFHEFLKASFGEKNFIKNLQFVEDCLGKDIRKYLTKDFYKDHIKRYKKRPIYWMFSSPKGHFKVLVYLHRYTPDTLSRILNNYLREFMSKLSSEKERQQDIVVTGAPREQAKALKEIDKIEKQIDDCLEYEAILRELALERIELDLDDGVLVNYNKMGKAVATVPGLNDAKAKKKVRGFDWIDTTQIR